MPLYRCQEVVSDDEKALVAEGKPVPKEIKLDRKRVWIPINDAAKATKNGCQEAIDLGLYKPAKGESPDEMKEKLLKKETELAKLGKGLPT